MCKSRVSTQVEDQLKTDFLIGFPFFFHIYSNKCYRMSTEENCSLSLDDDSSSLKEIKLVSSKSLESYVVSFTHAKLSKVIQAAFTSNGTADNELPLNDLEGPIIKSIVEYLQLCNGNEPEKILQPLRSKVMSEVTTTDQAKFIDDFASTHTRDQLYQLISAANQLDIDGLLHLGCAKVASLIKGEPLEKIKEILQAGSLEEKKEL